MTITQADLDNINKNIGDAQTVASGINNIFQSITGTGKTTSSPTVQSAAQPSLEVQKTDYKPWLIGGVLLIGVIVLLKKKGRL